MTHLPKVVLVGAGLQREVMQEVVLVEVDSLMSDGSAGIQLVCARFGESLISEWRTETKKAKDEPSSEKCSYEPMLTVQVPSLF